MLVLVNEIRTGQIKPAELDIDTRREVVRYLTGEGLSSAEVAKLLDTCDRTVRRDLVVIREANALEAHPRFAAQFAGEALEAARSAAQRVRRVGREAATPAAVRVEAERTAVEVMLDVGRLFLRMGHLPSLKAGWAGGTGGEGNDEHASLIGKTGSWDELVPELDRLAEIATSESSPAVPIIVGLRDAVKVAQRPSPPGESGSPAEPAPPRTEGNP